MCWYRYSADPEDHYKLKDLTDALEYWKGLRDGCDWWANTYVYLDVLISCIVGMCSGLLGVNGAADFIPHVYEFVVGIVGVILTCYSVLYLKVRIPMLRAKELRVYYDEIVQAYRGKIKQKQIEVRAAKQKREREAIEKREREAREKRGSEFLEGMVIVSKSNDSGTETSNGK